jgi:sterol desaturase/sphingolipid hydroxylase (fatty acid hydroxylase superfamily)
MQDLFDYTIAQLWIAAKSVAIPLPLFALLALLTKRRDIVAAMRRSADQVRISLLMLVTDTVLMVPVLTVLIVALDAGVEALGFTLLPRSIWYGVPPVIVAFVGVFVADLIAYWRHRLEHTAWLWPSHAVHHSDTEMTWFAIFRFHPINRLSTVAVDSALLAACGFPPYVALVNAFVRHYYGAFIHADLPWTYGPLGRIFVSPAMHRWHHALDRQAFNSNYATVFSAIDWIFGTWRVPGPCTAPLGVTDPMGRGFLGQLLHPLRPTSYAPIRALLRRKPTASIPAERT